jgi:hypothetical protein
LRSPDAARDLRGVSFKIAGNRIYLEKSYSQFGLSHATGLSNSLV